MSQKIHLSNLDDKAGSLLICDKRLGKAINESNTAWKGNHQKIKFGNLVVNVVKVIAPETRFPDNCGT